MVGMTRTIIPWSINADQVTLPLVIAEHAMYTDARVEAQVVTNMHAVSISARVEYLITMVNIRDLISTVVGPFSVLNVNSFMISISQERNVKPSGEKGTENRTISTERLVTGSMANANTWKV
jgi:hypothetical protein